MSVVWRESPENETRYVRSGSAANAPSPSSTASPAAAAGAEEADGSGAGEPDAEPDPAGVPAEGDAEALVTPGDGRGPIDTGWHTATTAAARSTGAAARAAIDR